LAANLKFTLGNLLHVDSFCRRAMTAPPLSKELFPPY
jgi:hypothetical protein